jgi:hypothetical protein
VLAAAERPVGEVAATPRETEDRGEPLAHGEETGEFTREA